MKLGEMKITISFEIKECEGRRKPTANNRFRPTIDAWLESWKSDDRKDPVNVPQRDDESPDEV